MKFELLSRIHKELSITSSALYEAVLAVSEQVNRKVQIIRLHWHASNLLSQIESHEADLGKQLVDQIARRFITLHEPAALYSGIDSALEKTSVQVHSLKQALLTVDSQIREIKLEAIHEDLLRLQRDLALRSAGLERLTVKRRALAVGQPLHAMPGGSSVRVVTILRGPFLLSPSEDFLFRQDDVVLLVGHRTDLDTCITWFTSQHPIKTVTTKSA